MFENDLQVCPHCGKKIQYENLIVCTNCGKEIYSVPKTKPEKYNLFSAYKAMFVKMFDFRSRSGRAEYWYAYLANLIVLLIFLGAFFFVDYKAGHDLTLEGNVKPIYKTVFDILNYISIVYSLVVFIPQLSLIVRRLHDTNRSAFFLLFFFAAPIGSVLILFFLMQRGTKGLNRYGDI